MTFKYEEYHRELTCDCPDIKNLKPTIRTAYRFSHEDLDNPNNFLPPLLINSSRNGNKCELICSGYALSFFTSMALAEKKYEKIANGHAPQFIETVGRFIAECELRENDGVANKPGSNGHFDLHEFQNTSLVGRFKLVKRVRL